jgi:stromal membrane-associated protein
MFIEICMVVVISSIYLTLTNLSQEDTREFVGELNITVVKGTNLAVRDMLTSDPYVVLTLGGQVCLYT